MYQLYKGKDVNTKNYDIFADKLDKWLKQRLLLVSWGDGLEKNKMIADKRDVSSLDRDRGAP